ncbi:MAG: adenylate/guanylate cyclase [Flavipsychrobacter sp.]|jgi:adenylate cyclase|nr:adenylate/guanylate cyclase [Flavipsychrobacter sp.]
MSFVRKYNFRMVLVIAVTWTVTDLIYWVKFMHVAPALGIDGVFQVASTTAIILRCFIVFMMSYTMCYILIFRLRQKFRFYPLLVNLLAKTAILLIAAVVMNFLLHITYSIFILNLTFSNGLHRFFDYPMSLLWLAQHSVGWIVLFVLTQVIIEINEKYSPGVFWAILIGKYRQPRVQKRIVMFMDLQRSTPIAETLGSKENFKFIRDFIYYVSTALMEYDGRIYQYVGDEIVVSWLYSPKNVEKCLDALKLSFRLLKKNSVYFRSHYGIVPEFKAGIHVGDVTVGEIGVIKKDIAMNGDTMNTTARICSVCNEFENKYIASKAFIDNTAINCKTENIGVIYLKGKTNSIELFGLRF